jgi:hypothetical protein
VNFSTEDIIAVLAAPALLFGVLRVVRALAPRLPAWPAAYIVALWAAVLGALAALIVLAVTTNVVLLAWIFAALGAWNVTRMWLGARRAAPPRP